MKNILIVDDDKEMRDLFTDYLAAHYDDVTISVSNDGVEALMKCTLEKFDLILLDYKMPRLNGLEFLMAVRSGHGLNESTPVIVSSGALPDIESAPAALPNTYFVPKPINFQNLQDVLKSLLS